MSDPHQRRPFQSEARRLAARTLAEWEETEGDDLASSGESLDRLELMISHALEEIAETAAAALVLGDARERAKEIVPDGELARLAAQGIPSDAWRALEQHLRSEIEESLTAVPSGDVIEMVRKAYYAISPHPNRGMTNDEIVERIAATFTSALTTATDKARREALQDARKAARGEEANRGAVNEVAAAYLQGRLDAASDIRRLHFAPLTPQNPGDAAPHQEGEE